MNPLDFLGLVRSAPSLQGARCRGSALFDPVLPGEGDRTAAERHRQAVGLCRGCPSLDPCRSWIDGLAPKDRPRGIVGGIRVDKRGRIYPFTPTDPNEPTEEMPA